MRKFPAGTGRTSPNRRCRSSGQRRCALARSLDGSITCGAPTLWTYTARRGVSRTSAPGAPAWSRWMCVRRMASRSPTPRPWVWGFCRKVSSVEPGPGSTMAPWPLHPPKRMRHSARSPSACQKVSWRQPKSGGSSQFHSCSTSSPPRKINSTIARIASGARKIHFFLMLYSSFLRKFVVNVLQSLTQMQHRITLAREQRIHAHAGLGGHLLEAAPFQFVSDENFTLVLGQFAERKFQFIKKHAAEVECFRSGIGRWQKIFDPQQFAVFVYDRCIAKVLRLLLAEKVRDAIPRDAKKPAGHVPDGHQQAIGFHQFVEDLLHDVLGVGGIGYTPADEIAQPGSLLRDDSGNSTVLLDHRGYAQRPIHPFL